MSNYRFPGEIQVYSTNPFKGINTRRYAIAGILVGFAFPLIATLLQIAQSGLAVTFFNIISVQRNENLLWIIDTAPLFLGLFAALAGRRQDALAASNRKLTEQEADLRQSQADLEQRVSLRTQELERRSNQSNLSAMIAQQIIDLHDVTTLLNRVVHLLAERGGYDHVGIFLTDENRDLIFLQSSSSEKGRELISRGYHASSEGQNILNEVLSQNRYLYTNDIVQSPEYRDDNFPSTRSRAIFPMTLRGVLIGLIDIHSNKTSIFNQDDLDSLSSLVRTLGISIENIRLLKDTNALVEQLSSTSTQQITDTWRKISERRYQAYQYTPTGVRPFERNESKSGSESGLSVPLRLRGETIGTITLQRGSDSPEWSERERALVEKISTQVALALDNSRLIEDVQRSAQRDQLLTAVSSRIRETLDLELILQKSVQEFVRAMNLKEAEVRLAGSAQEKLATGALLRRPPVRGGTRPLA